MNEIFLEDRGLQENYKCNENTMVGGRDSGFKGHLYLPRGPRPSHVFVWK